MERHKAVFAEELGTYTGPATKIIVDPTQTPRFCKARSVPYALRERVNEQLKQLEAEGIIQPVTHSDGAAPIVPVVKANKQIRIFGDFKQTVNKAARVDVYPIPTVEDILATLAKGKYFSKLDLSQAYNQLPLDDVSRQYTTINTSRGLFQYTRLSFGVSAAPSIFQRVL